MMTFCLLYNALTLGSDQRKESICAKTGANIPKEHHHTDDVYADDRHGTFVTDVSFTS